ncbi:MAG TPA: hypothetical protein VFK80_06625, partial [Limnochordia bacterium]|nr:hypothetical protein [Limnochordia bacterium]
MRLRRLVDTAAAGAIALGAAAGVASAKESITYWNPWTFGGYIKIQEDLVNRFNQAHPDIEVKIANSPGYDKLVAAVAAGA